MYGRPRPGSVRRRSYRDRSCPTGGHLGRPYRCRGQKIPALVERGFLRLFLRDVVLVVAGHEVVGLHLFPGGDFLAALFRRVGAAGMELAARGRVAGTGCCPRAPRDPSYSRDRAPGWLRRAPWCRGAWGWRRSRRWGANSTMLPRYMTPTVSEMCSTTLKSWLIKR